MMTTEFLKVGINKGEFDFEINAAVSTLSFEDMQELRAMIITAIGSMEEIIRIEVHKKALQESSN